MGKGDTMQQLRARIAELEAVRHDKLCNRIATLTRSLDNMTNKAEHFRKQRDEARAEVERLKKELDRRKGDPVTRLHNLCEALEEPMECGHDISEWCDNCETCMACRDESGAEPVARKLERLRARIAEAVDLMQDGNPAEMDAWCACIGHKKGDE